MFSSDLCFSLEAITTFYRINVSTASVLYVKAVDAIGHICLINFWHTLTSYCTYSLLDFYVCNSSPCTYPALVNARSSGWWRNQFMPQEWPPGWEASGIVMTVWDRTTKRWSFWVRTTIPWETSVSEVGDSLRTACSRVMQRLWDSRSLDQDPPRPMESAGWDPRWETGGLVVDCWLV